MSEVSIKLDKMTPEELGKLFPIIISEPDAHWVNLFQTEKINIEKKLGQQDTIRIEHIGSTAVPNLKAKPTIDILLEVPEAIDKEVIIEKLGKLEYHYIPRPENPPPHMMFVRGYTENGFRGQAYHIHVRYHGDWDELYFRDYLITHPEIVQEYGALKVRLANQYRNNRDEYTEQKGAFIKRITEMAKKNQCKTVKKNMNI